MDNISTSVLAKLKNKAELSGRSNQLCIQLFCQEEFLRRLESSRYCENLVLKGGLFLYSITNFDSRITTDVDFLIRNLPNSPEELQLILEEIIRTPSINDYISFEISSIKVISEQKQYSGIEAKIITTIKNTKTTFSIDFGVGDVIIPRQEKRIIPTQLENFVSPTIYTYSVESTIAEKLDAILDLMEFSSRMKDYFDIYYLLNRFDFDGLQLTTAIKETFLNRNRNFSIDQFNQVILFSNDVEMQKKWKSFANKIEYPIEDFKIILSSINKFIAEPFYAISTNKKFIKKWSTSNCIWI